VDQFLEEGVSEEDVDSWVQSASILHSNGDALDIAVKDGRIVGVRGRAVDRVNKGRVDPKDLYGWQANNSEDRLQSPLVRKDGKLVEASWDEAMKRIVGQSKRLLEEKGRHPRVTMQVFQRHQSVLGGIDEAIAVLKECAGQGWSNGWEPGWEELEVHALFEGDEISPWETVMTIDGDYSLFAHLETVYLGCMARRTLVMRNVREVVEAANGKPILFFPARHDHWLVQTGDGWAAHVAGAIGVSTDAQASWWGGIGVGTVPHGLIAAYGGDTVSAARDFADRFAGEMNVTVLVDFENDSVRTALEVADALGEKLWGVRLDTSGQLVDRSLWHEMGDFRPTGVNSVLVERVREALDGAGHERIKIVASGGFDAARIRRFEEEGTPVDSYGVGSALLHGENDFTADVVRVDGRDCAKVGRRYHPNPRLQRVG
jgi:nicotinate phosphoribosyltransferase